MHASAFRLISSADRCPAPTVRSTVRAVDLGSGSRRVREAVSKAGDVVLAAALTVLCQVEAWSPDAYHTGPRNVLALTTLAMTVPLALRRRRPVVVAVFVAAVVTGQTVFLHTPHPPDSPFLAWMLAVYSVAAHADLRGAVAGGTALVAAVAAWASVVPQTGANDLVFLSVILGGFWIAGRVVRSRALLAAALAERTRELEAEREARERLAVAAERTRIARELHDVVAHTLGMIVLQSGGERLHLPEGRARETLESIERSGREALGEMGRLVGVLRSDDGAGDGTGSRSGDRGPQPSVGRLAELVENVRRTGLAVELVVEGEPRPLGAGAEVSAYRIVQEALTNTLRHGAGTRARVRLRWDDTALEIEVADDGTGPPAEPPRRGHGLLGIRERVSLYGGGLVTGRSDLGGYLLVARLPLAAP
jgi:signal transduction histidine kinase